MSVDLGGGELTALAAAIGLTDASGDIDPGWFAEPLTRLSNAVRTPSQRAALTDFLDLILPASPAPGRPVAEKWHPLLGDGDRGNLYLTVAEVPPGLVLGLAGEFTGVNGAPVPASLRVQGDLLAAGTDLDLVVGTAAHPIVVELRVETGWAYAPPARPIGLAAVAGRFSLVPDPDAPGVSMELTLEQLSLGGEPPADTTLDVADLGATAPDLLAALLKVVLAEGGDPSLTRLADHFLALFGLDDADPATGVPAFPFAGLAAGAGAARAWMAQVLGADGSAATAGPWLEHLAGLLGADVTATGSGTAADPWRVTLADFGGGQVYATVALVDGRLRAGAGVQAGGPLGPGAPELSLVGDVAAVDVPLDRSAPAVAVPRAAVVVRATGFGGGALVDSGPVRIGSLEAGVAWDGSDLRPTLVLLDNRFDTTPYPRLDLTNVDSVEAAAADLVVGEITAALGDGAGRRLAVLAGLVPPEDPDHPGTPLPGWASHLDLARFVTDPPGAIADYHRAVLLDGDRWRFIQREIALLAGLDGVVTGAGTEDDPWAVPIAADVAALQLVAWHQPAPGDPGVHQLRLGMRLAATPDGSTFALLSEVLAADLQSTGPNAVRFLGAQSLRLTLRPALESDEVRLDSLEAGLGWQPGAGLGWQIRAAGLTIEVGGDTVSVGELHLPPTVPFDPADLPGSAAALGLDVAALADVVRLVLVLLAEQAGDEVELGAALLGLHRGVPGVSEDSPLLIDPADPGLLLRDPLGALRGWLTRLVAHVGTAGQPSLLSVVRLIGSLGTEADPEAGALVEDAFADAEAELADLLDGVGTYHDPWRMTWPGATAAAGPALEVWLEPAGAPVDWLGGLRSAAAQAVTADDLAAALRQIAWFDPQLRSLLRDRPTSALIEQLVRLDVHLRAGDGVVLADSQAPDVFGWVHGVVVDAAHPQLPAHPDVIIEVLARVEQVRDGGPRTVLLIGPDFSDHTAWAGLLAAPELAGATDPAAHVDLRTPGIDPRTIALDGLTAVADFYTADLAPGDVEFGADQLAHLADRLAVLHPGPITVVAHSTAGLVARRFAADHPDRVAGLVTIGTPHLGAPLTFLHDDELGEAIRLAGVLTPQLAAGPLRDALEHLGQALEGYRPAPSAGTLDTSDPYPEAAFTAAAPFDLGDIPVFMISGGLAGDPIPALAAALAAHTDALAATPRSGPTHLAYGMAMPIVLDSPPEAPSATARVRYGIGQIALGAAPPPPPRPAQQLRVELDLSRADGWLVGGPAASAADGRLRGLQLGLTASAATGGGVTAVLDARLEQAAWRGVTTAVAGLGDPVATPLLGAAFAAALAGGGSATGAATPGGLADALGALGLVATDAAGVTSLSADAFAALRTDPVGRLAARIPAALARPGGWAGLIAQGDDGAFRYAPPGSPYGIFARPGTGGWRTGVETTTALDAPLWVSADVELDLPAFAPTAELALHLGAATLRYRTANGTVLLDVEPLLDGVQLLPTPTPATLGAALESALPDVLATGVLSAVLARIVPDLDLAGLSALLHGPGEMLAGALGPDPAAVSAVLAALNDALGLPAGTGLQLPGDVSVTATADPGGVALGVATTAPIGGVLGLAFALVVDAQRRVTPAGSVTVRTPLTGTWPQVSVTFGAGPGGLNLSVAPQGVPPITLLPVFSGLGALRGAGAALLPQVLDAALGEAADPRPAWLDHTLAAAGHLGLYDDAGGFAAHSAEFAAMLAGTWFDGIATGDRQGAAQAAVDLLTLIPGLPGTLDAPGTGLVRWTHALPPGVGDLRVSAGWGADGPAVTVAVTDLRPAGAPALLTVTAGVDRAGVAVTLSAAADLGSIGVAARPRFSLDLDTAGALRARLLPLAGETDDGPLVVTLAPAFAVAAGAETARALLTGWALPLAVQVALVAADPVLGHPLWTGGPTLRSALTDAGILTATGLAHPLPDVPGMLAGFVAGAAGQLDVPVGDLRISLAAADGRVGLVLRGQQKIPLGDLELDVLFGAPQSWGAAAGEGLEVLLVDLHPLAFDLGVRLRGVGVGLSRADGTALVAETALRLGSFAAYLFLELETGSGALVVQHGGAGVRLGGFGLPLSAALSGSAGGNPVAANLVGSGGAGGANGDAQAVNPAADVDAWYWDDGGPDASLRVLVGGQTGLFWIPVQAGFGPIFIDEIGVGVSDTRLTMAIDGGVTVAGLSAEVDELSVAVPYATAGDPSTWTLDLKGLAVGYTGPSVAIAGGLVKFDGPPIEYDGMLLVEIGSIGAIVIGSYGVVGSGAGGFTSLAIFGGVFVPIGIPPIVELTGVALGLGYNRRLVIPDDLDQIPDFPLVQALDRPEELANDPMKALYSFRGQVPPARGALWLAAGVRGTTFELINITAVVYVALDSGLEVGLLGVARMALPSDDTAIASIELAVKARFSTAEGLFSEQAQLTDNSWLISRDCRLTGGYALFAWFRESQFLLTLGGYHPSFKPLPEYPVVPRIGYEWSFLGVVHLKGESYFALTTTAVMTGTRMEATYGPDWIQVWFTAYADILVTRDPFHYEVDVGVSVGARLRIRVCFFACVSVEISVSVGASLHLAGPPFHGTVTADLGVTSVTVPFGDDAAPPPPPKHWDQFVREFVQAGDANATSVQAQVAAGLLPAEPAGGPVAPGTAAQPWRLSAEWTMLTETRMPARGFALQLDTPMIEARIGSVVFGRVDKLAAVYDFDLAPMFVTHNGLSVVHRVVLARRPEGGGGYTDMVPDSLPAPADGTLVLRHAQFTVTPRLAQVSEATYHLFPDLKPPAAANTLPVLAGLQLDGIARLHGSSAVVPIGTLVDATNFRPLPFAFRSPGSVIRIKDIGAAWLTLAEVGTGVSDAALVRGVAGILGGAGGEFARLRAESGLRPAGYDPVAVAAVENRRSAPPVLSALSEGFTLQPVGRGTAEPPTRVGPVAGVPLAEPRLRTVMQRPVITAPVATAGRTSVRALQPTPTPTPVPVPVPVVDVRNDLVTAWDVAGMALLRRPAADASQPTRAPRSARSVRNAALGAPTGRAAARQLAELGKAAPQGVTVRAGVTHLWELPPASGWQVLLGGDSAARVTLLSTAGTVLSDQESYPGDRRIVIPSGTGMLAVTALGRPGDGPAADGFGRGAVAGSAAAGGRAVLGWQSGGHAIQVGPTTLLARGAVLRLGAPVGLAVRAQTAASGVAPIADALAAQQVAGTELPPYVTVVGVLVDSPTSAEPGPDDVLVRLDGADARGLPQQVVSGRRTLFLYDVRPAKGSAAVVVAAGLTGVIRLAGVLGGTGTAAEWAALLAGSTLTRVVPDEHLTPDGSLSVRLMKGDDNG